MEEVDFWPEKQATLLKRNLNNVLLDDLSQRDSHLLHGGPSAGHTCEGTAPGEGEGTPKRHVHGLPAGHLPPLAGLPLQTLDSLEMTQQPWFLVKRGAKATFLPHASTNTHSWGMFLRESQAFHARKDLN